MSLRAPFGWPCLLLLVISTNVAVAQLGPTTGTKGTNVPKRPGAPPTQPIEIADEPKTVDPATLVPASLAAPATVQFNEASLKEIIAWLQTELKITTILDTTSLSDEGILISEPITDRLQNEPVYLLLDRLSALGLGWYLEDGLLHITTLTRTDEMMSTISYNLGDLFDAGFESSHLLHGITQATTGHWEDVDGVGGEMVLLGDVLFVRHTHKVHREVAGLFAAIRKHGRRTFTHDPPQHAELREKLSQPISVDFQAIPLTAAVLELSRLTGVDVRLDRSGLKDVGVRERTPVSLKLNDQKFSTILRVLLAEHNLDWVLRDGILQITSDAVADEYFKAAVYDVRDLCQNEEESFALYTAIQSQARAQWEDRDGTGGTLIFARPGVMVVFQSERTQDDVLQLLENYRTALRASKPRARTGVDPQEVITRYYRLPTVMVRELVDTLPTLIRHESWQSAELPDALGTRKSIPSQPGPLPSGQSPQGTPIVVEHSILIVKQTRQVHQELGKLLEKLQTGDPLVEPESVPGSGQGGFGGGGFGGQQGGFGGGFPTVK